MSHRSDDDGALEDTEDGLMKQVLYMEDLLLLSRFDEAATSSLELVSRLVEAGNGNDAVLQRAIVVALQALFFVERQGEAEALVEKLGLYRLTVPTFAAWVLFLLQSDRAAAARQQVERYMAAIVESFRELQQHRHQHQELELQQQQQPQHAEAEEQQAQAGPGAAAAVAEDAGGGTGGGGSRDRVNADVAAAAPPAGAGLPSALGAAAATLQDRAALARLYSQDVLTLGLQLPQEALRWLRPRPKPAQQPPRPPGSCSTPAQQQQQQQQRAAEVVGAMDLLDCEDTLRQLYDELKRLTVATGLLAAAAAANGSSSGGGSDGRRSGSIDSASGSGGGGGYGASASLGLGAGGAAEGALKSNAAGTAPAHRGGPSSRAAQRPPGSSSSSSSAAAAAAGPVVGPGPGPGPGAGPAPSSDGSVFSLLTVSGGRRRRSLAEAAHGYLSSPGRLPVLAAAIVRTWLAAAYALVRHLTATATAHLTRAQAWLVCRAAAAAARLHTAAAAYGSAGQPSWGLSLSRGAAAVALGAVVLVAMQAEAPHLRTALQGRWTGMVGLLREAMRMGLALHPSPMATVGRAVH